MVFTQVYCTIISFSWRIIGFTCLLIITTSVVSLIFKWWRCFFGLCFYSWSILSPFALLFGLSGSWILYFPLIKVSKVLFLLSLRGILSLSGDTVVTLAPGLDILGRIGLSLLTYIYFGCYMLVLLSHKMSDEIDLDLFIVFTVYFVSVIWEALDLSNNLDLSNDIPCLIHFRCIYLFYFEMLVVCLFCLWCQFILLQWDEWWLCSSQYVFFFMSLILSLMFFYVVANNGFLEEMILVSDIFYLVCYKTRVILQANFY